MNQTMGAMAQLDPQTKASLSAKHLSPAAAIVDKMTGSQHSAANINAVVIAKYL